MRVDFGWPATKWFKEILLLCPHEFSVMTEVTFNIRNYHVATIGSYFVAAVKRVHTLTRFVEHLNLFWLACCRMFAAIVLI